MMEGIKIELKGRDEDKSDRKNVAPPTRYYSRSSVYHSYTFRFDKPYRRFHENGDPILKTKTLELPPDVSAFNAGTSLERWSKKRPRLKSGKRSEAKERTEELLEEEEDSKEVEECEEEENDEEEEEENVPEDDTDDNVKKLIEDSSKFNAEDFFKTYKPKPKPKKPARKKTIRFKLSKPQVDETVQVIKVDITSNYSYQDVPDDSSSDGEDYSERFKNIINSEQSGNTVEQDFTVICKKLTLACRD